MFIQISAEDEEPSSDPFGLAFLALYVCRRGITLNLFVFGSAQHILAEPDHYIPFYASLLGRRLLVWGSWPSGWCH